MSKHIHFGAGCEEDELPYTKEEVRSLPTWPFIERKSAFDACLGDILDEVVDARASFLTRYIIRKAERRKRALGEWYDNFLALNVQWAQIATKYDEEYKSAYREDQLEIEQEYLCFERANIRGLLESVSMHLSDLGNHPVLNKLGEIEIAWCQKADKPRPNAMLEII